ncbi:MAG: hypothetical protein A3B37_00740 [Candidatus Sungbacteria bacterium RIFCSPLOWO2_01_FULL_59_16]|uniref:Methyltransferase domain-containing protein n=1 Tax=Candidatus Sungbacteria bacterium RIFCSPLOWO2_01_FULL_59_16 TaxID=1802280 RepID=A0A1G2LDF9_9BACT|nr:MAG: hypothetical protein A3B37_00740 [Candidatus Sungbacteria bacterium RIFCSPLOWO2_01_FULL_59_16]
MNAADPGKLLRRFLLQVVKPGERILDIGCGSGSLPLFLVSRRRCSVEGIDASAARVHRANKKFRKPRRGVAVCRLANAENMRLNMFRAPFHLALVTNALHHFDAYRALRRTRAMLLPGGRILIAEYAPSFGERIDDCPRYSEKKIRSLLADAGFTDITAHRLDPRLNVLTAKRRGVVRA